MDIRRLDPDELNDTTGHSKRLLPWPTLNAPFEGAYSVIRPGCSSPKHAHHEGEVFVAASGEAVVESRGERMPFVAGDMVHFPPGHEHQIFNETDLPFTMFSVWWDADMSKTFLGRHESES